MVTDADRCICWGEDCPKHGIDIVDGMVVYRDAAAPVGGVLPSNDNSPTDENTAANLRMQAAMAADRGDDETERIALDGLALIERRLAGRSNDEPTPLDQEETMTIYELNDLIGACQSGGRQDSILAAEKIRQQFRDLNERLEVLTPSQGTPAEIVRRKLLGLDEGWDEEQVTDEIVGALYASGHLS